MLISEPYRGQFSHAEGRRRCYTHNTKGQAPPRTVLSDLDRFAQGIGGSAERRTSLPRCMLRPPMWQHKGLLSLPSPTESATGPTPSSHDVSEGRLLYLLAGGCLSSYGQTAGIKIPAG